MTGQYFRGSPNLIHTHGCGPHVLCWDRFWQAALGCSMSFAPRDPYTHVGSMDGLNSAWGMEVSNRDRFDLCDVGVSLFKVPPKKNKNKKWFSFRFPQKTKHQNR